MGGRDQEERLSSTRDEELAFRDRFATMQPDASAFERGRLRARMRQRLLGAKTGWTVADRFEVHGVLGEGGLGTVYRAHDQDLDRPVALKVLRGESSGAAEAAAMAQLSHPHVVDVFAVVTAGDATVIVMQLIDGDNLRQWLAETPRRREAILGVCLGAGEGLAAVHERGFVHRDVKPENILVTSSGEGVIADFGLADVVTAARAGGGTHAYAAPEQLEGGVVDARTDQFAFARTMLEALVPDASSDAERVARLPSSLGKPLARAIADSPDDRFESMESLLSALRQTRSPTRRIAIGVAALAGAAVVALLAMRSPDRDPAAGVRRAEVEDAPSEAEDAKRSELDRRLAALLAAQRDGGGQEALDGLRALRQEATAPGQTAEVDFHIGELEVALGNYASGGETLRRALEEAVVVGRSDLVAGAAVELARLEGIYESRPDDADPWLRQAEAALAQLPEDAPQWRSYHWTVGGVRSVRGDHEGSVAAYERMRDHVAAVNGTDSERYGEALAAVAGGNVALGRRELANRQFTEALDLLRRHAGPTALNTVGCLANVAHTLPPNEEAKKLELFEEVLRAHESREASDENLVTALLNVGTTLANMRRISDADPILARAVKLVDEGELDGTVLEASVYVKAGHNDLQLGRLDDARAKLVHALEVMRDLDLRQSEEAGMSLLFLAEVERAENDAEGMLRRMNASR